MNYSWAEGEQSNGTSTHPKGAVIRYVSGKLAVHGTASRTIPMQRDQDGVVEQNDFNDILTDQVPPAGTKQG